MTLGELFNDETVHTHIRVFAHEHHPCYIYKQTICLHTVYAARFTNNELVIYDYTTLTQDEINKLVDAKIKHDFRQHDCTQIFNQILFSINNKHITKYALSQVTSDLLHEIINKNEVFISNVNSLYSSNKMLAELDAL